MGIRILLVDDHEIVRRGIADMLESAPDLEIVGEAATVAGALALAGRVEADVAVLDVRLPDGNGIELCRELRARLPHLHCLILTSFGDERARAQAAAAGASGFVLKQVLGMELIDAVHAAGRCRES